MDRDSIKCLFKEIELKNYDFSKAPLFIKSKEKNILVEKEISKKDKIKHWLKAQRSFICWTKDKSIFSEGYVESGKDRNDIFFKTRGYLKGSILDIGGGWGLFRQWWKPGKKDVFLVHDPGSERFLNGPHKIHLDYYQRAFKMPMTFVEGFGEVLPYKDNYFDTCIIASVLDHCIEPKKVVSEAHRCLKPGGIILTIHSFINKDLSSHNVKDNTLYIKKRIVSYLRNPIYILKLPKKLFDRFRLVDHHLQDFDPEDIILLLKKVGFSQISSSVLPMAFYKDQETHAFEGIK